MDGQDGNNILEGRGGNDFLVGHSGNDTYIFSPGDGFDTIFDLGGGDILVINGSVLPDNLVYSRISDDLVIEIASGVTITGQFSGDASRVLERASFSGGPAFEIPNPFMSSGFIALGETFVTDEETPLSGNVLANEVGPYAGSWSSPRKLDHLK